MADRSSPKTGMQENPESVMLDAALRHAARGLPVFPCSPDPRKGRGKRPLLPRESAPGAKDGGLYLATTDEATIRQWWTRWPKALIAIPTGLRSGVSVVDLDPGSADADAMLAALRECWGIEGADPETGEVLSPAMVRTQSGGLHLWYAADPADRNRAAIFRHREDAPEALREGGNVDVRGEGGYVIVPPSVMGDGKSYGWRGLAFEDFAALPAMPPALRRALFEKPDPRTPDPETPNPETPPAGIPSRTGAEEAERRYALAALDGEARRLAAVGSGGRNHALNIAACKLGGYLAAGLLSESMIRGALEEASAANGLVRDDGWESVRRTIASGLAKGRETPRTPPPRPPAGSGRQSAPPKGKGEAPRPKAGGEPPQGSEAIAENVAWCAGLDHSDTDNARRLVRHFGADLAVIRQRGGKSPIYASWAGAHWDVETGNMGALATAQQLGGRIALEILHIGPTPDEAKAIEAGEALKGRKPAELTAEDRDAIEAGKAAAAAVAKRRTRRMAHAVTSKNKGRLEAMLACAAPHILRSPDDFNADLLKLATRSHTLVFHRRVERAPNPAFADPDNADPDTPPEIERAIVRLEARPGHARADLISQLVPVDYDPAAACPRWDGFLAQVQPAAEMRRLLQQSFGLGLLGLTVQRLFFHVGTGANGKSVAMEVMCRVLGSFAVSLPAESFFGPTKQGGGASPDIARLYGRRLLRVKELPEGEQLREAMIKELTGGEMITARSLFEGYIDFQPLFTAHMSGNAEPQIRDTSEGIWRRMTVVPWNVVIPLEKRREMDPFINWLMAEAPGILNWLIAGALDYLKNGLVLPGQVTDATAEYRADMDPLAGFLKACIEVTGRYDHAVGAAELYAAYQSWCVDAGRHAITNTRFGREMTRRAKVLGFTKESGRVNRYVGLRVAWSAPQPYPDSRTEPRGDLWPPGEHEPYRQ